tara:strand:+ start:533 stop:640 length:108 start_codon:yes stop_codon:yes gene_type:complete
MVQKIEKEQIGEKTSNVKEKMKGVFLKGESSCEDI